MERTDLIVFIYEVESTHFTYLSPSFEEIWQTTREKVAADPAFLLSTIHPEDRDYLLQICTELLHRAEEHNFVFRILLPEEKVKWVRMNLFLLTQQTDVTSIGGFVEDITSWKEHEINLHKFAARKDSVLEILSHDLAGPLTKIRGLSELIEERLKEHEDPELKRLLAMISETNERSIRLIREFVKKEFLESVSKELVKKRIDLVQLIVEIIDEYKGSEYSIDKTFTLKSSGEKVFIEIDDYKFSQVINNLISDAIKFTHDGGKITLGIDDRMNTVLVTVADNGIDIPDYLQSELFEKFTRARRPGIKGEPSVGLGMSIIKTIVEWHGGKIWCESQVNKGTTFL